MTTTNHCPTCGNDDFRGVRDDYTLEVLKRCSRCGALADPAVIDDEPADDEEPDMDPPRRGSPSPRPVFEGK